MDDEKEKDYPPGIKKRMENLNTFSTENQPENRGRKPSAFIKMRDEYHLSKDDVVELIRTILPKSKKQLQKMVLQDNKPAIMHVFAKSVLGDLKNKNSANIFKLIEYAMGKAPEIKELKGKLEVINKNVNYDELPAEEAKKIFFDTIEGDE